MLSGPLLPGSNIIKEFSLYQSLDTYQTWLYFQEVAENHDQEILFRMYKGQSLRILPWKNILKME